MPTLGQAFLHDLFALNDNAVSDECSCIHFEVKKTEAQEAAQSHRPQRAESG